MGRHPRLQVPGGLYHVTTRGNAGAPIYLDDHDRVAFLDRLGRTAAAHAWTTLAYCLMGNHFHLEIRTPDANIAKGMRSLKCWYAQRFNARYDRSGHLFEAPYHSELIERDEHLLEVARYIVRNPVRAGLRDRPEDWLWSSYRASIGLERAPEWLAYRELLAPFAICGRRCEERYREFVEDVTDRPRGSGPWTRSQDMTRVGMASNQSQVKS